MKTQLPDDVERARISGDRNSGPHGAFRILCPVLCRTLTIIVSDGREWGQPLDRPTAEEIAALSPHMQAHLSRVMGDSPQIVLPDPPWEHVSVSASTTPTWAEMCWVKGLFWDPDELAIQLHPPEADYVNVHARCLHLWRPIGVALPVPPLITV
jgi:hypothetical protein